MNHRLGNQLTAPLPACLSHSDYPRLVSSSHRMGEGRGMALSLKRSQEGRTGQVETSKDDDDDARRQAKRHGQDRKCCRRSSPDSRSGLRLCSKQFVQPRQVYVADQSLLSIEPTTHLLFKRPRIAARSGSYPTSAFIASVGAVTIGTHQHNSFGYQWKAAFVAETLASSRLSNRQTTSSFFTSLFLLTRKLRILPHTTRAAGHDLVS